MMENGNSFVYAGPYEWVTYKEVYDSAVRIGAANKKCGVNPGGRCGIYGLNSPESIIAMEACNSHAVCFVPLYDTLGANAVEIIINHAEVSIVYVLEKKIPAAIQKGGILKYPLVLPGMFSLCFISEVGCSSARCGHVC